MKTSSNWVFSRYTGRYTPFSDTADQEIIPGWISVDQGPFPAGMDHFLDILIVVDCSDPFG